MGVALDRVSGDAHRLAEPVPPIDPAHAIRQRRFRGVLQLQIERRVDGEAVLVELLRAVALLELLPHFLDEERRVGVERRPADGDDRRLHRLLGALAGDEPGVGHLAERVVAPPHGVLEVDVGAVAGRCLDDAGEQRRFLEGDVLGRLAEVEPRRRFDAVGAVAPRDLVAVERDDLGLGVALLDLDGEHRLLDLALPRLVVVEEQLAGELLRQRAGAGALALEEVAGQRHDDARDAEAHVGVELGVLGGHDRLPQHRRDLVVGDDDAPLRRELADDLAAGGVDARDRARGVVVERRDLGQVARVDDEHAGDRPARRREHEEQRNREAAEETADGAHRVAASRPLRMAADGTAATVARSATVTAVASAATRRAGRRTT